MNNLKKYQEECNNCSRCGLCQAVCPVFQVTKNDCDSPKGKFIMLNEFFRHNKKTSKSMKKYMSSCINCGKCVNFCPSKLDITKINEAFFDTFPKYKFLNKNYKTILKMINLLIKIWKLLKIDFFVNCFSKILYKCGKSGKNILFFNEIIKENTKLNKLNVIQNPKYKVLYFKGCYSKYINSSQKNAILNLLNKHNISVEIPKFECCGRFHKYTGGKNEFEKVKNTNSEIIKNSDFDFIIFDCPSCKDTLLNYPDIDKSKLMLISDFIALLDVQIPIEIVSYQKSCLQEKEPDILHKINYKKIDELLECCGGSFPFCLENKTIKDKMIANKVNAVQNANVSLILTDCPFCQISLKKMAIFNKINQKIISIVEFIEKK